MREQEDGNAILLFFSGEMKMYKKTQKFEKIKKLKKFKKGVDIFENLVYHKEVLRQDITKDKVPWSSG